MVVAAIAAAAVSAARLVRDLNILVLLQNFAVVGWELTLESAVPAAYD
jgi:hypothetical protein